MYKLAEFGYACVLQNTCRNNGIKSYVFFGAKGFKSMNSFTYCIKLSHLFPLLENN